MVRESLAGSMGPQHLPLSPDLGSHTRVPVTFHSSCLNRATLSCYTRKHIQAGRRVVVGTCDLQVREAAAGESGCHFRVFCCTHVWNPQLVHLGTPSLSTGHQTATTAGNKSVQVSGPTREGGFALSLSPDQLNSADGRHVACLLLVVVVRAGSNGQADNTHCIVISLIAETHHAIITSNL